MAETIQTPVGANTADDAPANGREAAIVALFAAGWLLVTLGIWGACGRPWWIWPLSVGLGLLVAAGIATWIAAEAAAAETRRLVAEPPPAASTTRQHPVPISSAYPGARPA